jgi:hypothetical protein
MRRASLWAWLVLVGLACDDTLPAPVATYRVRGEGPPALGDGPYPSDRYLSGGRVQLSLPPARIGADPAALARLRDVLAQDDGFGATTAVLFPVRGEAIDPRSLDADAALLMSLADGRVIPARASFAAGEHAIVLSAGEVLVEGVRYGALVTTRVRDVRGRALAADPDFAAARAVLAPLWDRASARGIAQEAVASATVFTVHDATRSLVGARVELQSAPLQTAIARSYVGPVALAELFGDESHSHIGVVALGKFAVPATSATASASVPFLLVLPADGGIHGTYQELRVILYAHGLEGSRKDALLLADDLAARSYAVLALDAPHHGGRQAAAQQRDTIHDLTGAPGPDGLYEPVPGASVAELYDLAGGDPRVLRDATRQSAAELTLATRLIAEGDWSAVRALDPALGALAFEAQKIALVGASFGADAGLLAMAVEPRLGAGLLVGAAGGFVQQVAPNAAAHGPALAALFDRLYGRGALAAGVLPALLHQQALEPGDPLAYAAHLITRPEGANLPKSVLLVEARADEIAPNQATGVLAAALGVPLLLHARSPAGGLPTAPPLPAERTPVVANLIAGTSRVTGGLLQLDPATSNVLSAPTDLRRFPAPAAVENPTAELRRLLLRYADTYFEPIPGVPQVIDPFAP